MDQELSDQISNFICGDLHDKIDLLNMISSQTPNQQHCISLKIQELSQVKILVKIHRKSPFLLVTAHSQLGEAYLNAQYYEQALDHLSTSLKINSELLQTVEEAKDYQIHLMTMISRCYLEAGNTKDSQNLIEKSLAMCKQHNGLDSISICPLLQLQAKLFLKVKQYQKALDCLEQSVNILQQLDNQNEIIGFSLAEMANVYEKMGNNNQRGVYLIKSVQFFESQIKFNQSETLARLLCDLSRWREQQGQIQPAIDDLNKAIEIQQQIYGVESQQVIKIKRSVALVLLTGNLIEQAIAELQEVEQLQQIVFGDQSANLAKTKKFIGTLLAVIGDKDGARDYLAQAVKMYQNRGMLKQLKEAKQKLATIDILRKQQAQELTVDQGMETGSYEVLSNQ